MDDIRLDWNVLESVSMLKLHVISMFLQSLTDRNCRLHPDDFWWGGSMNTFSGSKPVAGKIGNLVLKQRARVPSLGLPFAVKLSSLKVSILFQSNFPVPAASVLFPLNCRLQRGRAEWSSQFDAECVINPWGILNTISYGMRPSSCSNLGSNLCQPKSVCGENHLRSRYKKTSWPMAEGLSYCRASGRVLSGSGKSSSWIGNGPTDRALH